jgi:colicin import membrane protein
LKKDAMRKSLAISAVLHAVALLWGLITFNAAPFEPSDSQAIPVEFVSATDFSKMTAGIPDAAVAEKPKPVAEKVAETKTPPTPAQKISEKQEIVTATAEPPPSPETKKPEPKAKPIPAAAESKPEKTEKVEQKTDPIAEALKKEESKKEKEKESEQKQAEAKPTPLPPKRPAPPQPKFDAAKVAALLDKRDPQRQAIAGDAINTAPSLGTPGANAPELSQSELDALIARLRRLWSPPVAFAETGNAITIRIILGRDRRLVGGPEVKTAGKGPMYEAARDAAIRALYQAQPFDMLRTETFETWRDMEITFDPRWMFSRG